MDKKVIFTIIGGGSVNWMRGLMRDIYLLDCIGGGEIRLVDPNIEHVEAVRDMLLVFNTQRDKDYKISIVEDRKEALRGANFVLTTFSPGSMDAFHNDLEIPTRYGVRLPVSMTAGISGISASLRTASEAYDIVCDMEDMCPGAWILNVTNPMTAVVKAMSLAAKTVTVVGFCHEFNKLRHLLEVIFDIKKPEDCTLSDYFYRWLPENGFDYTIAGINHFIWLTKASLNGKDVIPVIREYTKNHLEIKNNDMSTPFSSTDAIKFALCRNFGYMPVVGDRHLVEFYPSMCNPQNGFASKHKVSKTTVDYRRSMKVTQLKEIQDIASGKVIPKWEGTDEGLGSVIKSVITGQKARTIVNLVNTGQISNLPLGSVVETLADFENGKVTPVFSGDMPPCIDSLCRLHIDVVELVVQASLTGDRDLFTKAVCLDPSTGGADFLDLPKLAEELLEANKEWLPRFFKLKQ